jgi:hypothetical protein
MEDESNRCEVKPLAAAPVTVADPEDAAPIDVLPSATSARELDVVGVA